MRVSIINGNLVAKDGVGQSVLEQYHFFHDKGYEVQIYTLSPPSGVSKNIVNATKIVTLNDLLACRDRHFAHSELYIYHYPIMYPLMESIRSIERGFVIFYYHNVTPANLWRTNFNIDFLHIGYAAISRLAPYADLIVTPSEFNAEQLFNEHGCDRDKIRVIPLPVHLEDFQPGTADQDLVQHYNLEDRQVILFVGRFAGNKRVDLLVEALPLVQESIPNASLLLVGDGETSPAYIEIKDQVCQRAKELGVENDVIFAGIVEDLPAHYRLADVYATASLHEGFGIPLIEAMASGVPVVASNTTSHPRVVGDAGLLCEPDDSKSLAEQVIQLLTDQTLYDDQVQRGLRHVQTFSPAATISRWMSLMDEITTSQFLQTQNAQVQSMRVQNFDLDRQWLFDKVGQLEGMANTMIHGYTIDSRIPIIGPLIAWIRRHLTSHLREPYLDPILHKQEDFNRLTIDTLLMMVHQPYGIDRMFQNRHGVKKDQHLLKIEAQVNLLSARLSLLEAQQKVEASEDKVDVALLNDLRTDLENLQEIK